MPSYNYNLCEMVVVAEIFTIDSIDIPHNKVWYTCHNADISISTNAILQLHTQYENTV